MSEKQKEILIIEDDRDIAYQARMRLESRGFKVHTAFTGTEGLRMARELKPAAVIMDIMVPELDGYRLCRLLKFDREYEHIPVIITTARNLEEDRELALEMGADAYFTKPVDWKALFSTLETFLEVDAEQEA